jgi:hypothetical protein
MASRRVDSLKAKQRKQKILAAGLGVVFLAVAVFQGPKLWKQLHPASSKPVLSYDAKPAATAGGSPTLAAPTLSGSQTPGAAPSTGGSLAAAPAPVVADGQLTSFSRFASKDPFAQQLRKAEDGGSTSTPSSPAGGSSGGSSTGSGGTSSPSSGGSASAPTPGTAVISVNGTLYTVAVGSDFPSAGATDPSIIPVFHLVSLTAHTAKISIAGGSYANGAPAVTLRENKSVTLMNTADGTRYKLILKPVGTPVAAAPAPTSTSSTTVTVPPPSAP